MITLSEEIYTNFTTKNAELYHHGIEGQKWGIRNGPPYPLDSDSRKERRAARKSEKEEKKRQKTLAKAERQKDVAKAAAMRSKGMTDEELAQAIVRTQSEITYVNMRQQLNRQYILSSKEFEELSNSKANAKKASKEEAKRTKRDYKQAKALARYQAKQQMKVANNAAKNAEKMEKLKNKSAKGSAKSNVVSNQGQQNQKSFSDQAKEMASKSLWKAAEQTTTTILTTLAKPGVDKLQQTYGDAVYGKMGMDNPWQKKTSQNNS